MMRMELPTLDSPRLAPLAGLRAPVSEPEAPCRPRCKSGAKGGSKVGAVRTGGQSSSKRVRCSAAVPLRVFATTTASIGTRLVVPDLKLQFGERIKVVGQSAELGSWYLSAAPVLNWTEGDNWIHHIQLPPGSHEFKLLITRDDGSTYWEQGPNRTIEVPEGIKGLLEVKCSFGDASSTATAEVPLAQRDKDIKAIKTADEEPSTKESEPSSVPGAMEGDSAEREPDEKISPGLDELEKESSEGLEGVSPSKSDEQRQGNGSRTTDNPTARYGSHQNGASNGAVYKNGSASRAQLTEQQVEEVAKKVLGPDGESVRMYGGAEARELKDGSVMVKFPSDEKGEDLLKLVQRLLGYYEPPRK